MFKMQKFGKMWESETIEHKGFKDLGNYVIELPEFTDPEIMKRGLRNGNLLADHGVSFGGCTAMVKRNSKGEVVVGRNMDLDISQSPAYIVRSSIGKYRNMCVFYSPGFYLTYEEHKKLDEIDPDRLSMILLGTCDCLNEKGLYIEVNLREKNDKLYCTGLHSSHGEVTRDDGTPWADLRCPTTALPQMVSQNCATVLEAVEFIKNSFDWYTITPQAGSVASVSENNMSFCVGDATGMYGVIEMAQDEVNFIPYQFGYANYYITPKWNGLDTCGAGLGRLAMVSKVILPVETLEDAMDAMKPVMWRNETMWIGESERVLDGTRLNPFNQICFQDDKGVPQMDWRTEYVGLWPVMDDGRMLIAAKTYEEAVKATYDPMIKQYFDDAIETGGLVIDDGSYKFDVLGEKMTLEELQAKYTEYENTNDIETLIEQSMYYEVYRHLLTNLNNAWANDDYHYEAMKAAAYAKLHIRYDADGKFDPNAMSQYEKLCAFYGKGVEKDETPLRDDAGIWTTSLNVGVNCAKKEIKIRFWENDGVVFHAQF